MNVDDRVEEARGFADATVTLSAWQINDAGRVRLAALRAERKAASPGEKIWL